MKVETRYRHQDYDSGDGTKPVQVIVEMCLLGENEQEKLLNTEKASAACSTNPVS